MMFASVFPGARVLSQSVLLSRGEHICKGNGGLKVPRAVCSDSLQAILMDGEYAQSESLV